MKAAILLIGYGAIAREIRAVAIRTGEFSIGAILVRPERVAVLRAELPDAVVVGDIEQLPSVPALAVECASCEAVQAYGAALLRRGIDLVVTSIGALADNRLHDELVTAAQQGGARLIIPAGAVPGIDALNAAMIGGVDEVSYISRKPPGAWKGSPAETLIDLDDLTGPATFFSGPAREAARTYPKNANVAATIALAGLGLDATKVHLVADPSAQENTHEILARGTFGEMHLLIRGKPLPGNPRTSSLAAYSTIRAVLNQLRPVQI